MNSSSIIKILVLVIVTFIILQDCSIIIGTQALYVSSIMICSFLFIMLITNFTTVMSKILLLYKKTPSKYFIWFIYFIFLTAFFHGFKDGFNIIFRSFLIFILVVFSTILFATLIFPKIISYAKMFKIFLYSSLAILLYGVLDFILKITINVKPPLYSILCTKNYIMSKYNYSVNNFDIVLERACSIFFEPSFFATFIFLFLPLAYILYKSNVKIIKYKNLDIVFKLFLIGLFWICLFFTQSPIYIILCIIYTFLFFIKDILHLIKKISFPLTFFIIILTSFLIFFACSSFSKTSLDYKIVNRIYKTIESFNNLDILVVEEGSLATRIISTINTYQAFKKVPLIGCGYGNTYNVMVEQYKRTQTPITIEILSKYLIDDRIGASPNIFWSYLLQTGLIGIVLIYTFFIRSILYAYKIRNYYCSYNRLFLDTIILIAINYVIISFYWSLDTYPMMWFIFGLLNSFILTHKKSFLKSRALNIKEQKYE